MQKIIYGKKQKEIKIPVGWTFVKDGTSIQAKDRIFDLMTKRWIDIPPGSPAIEHMAGESVLYIAIRKRAGADPNGVNLDQHAKKFCGEEV